MPIKCQHLSPMNRKRYTCLYWVLDWMFVYWAHFCVYAYRSSILSNRLKWLNTSQVWWMPSEWSTVSLSITTLQREWHPFLSKLQIRWSQLARLTSTEMLQRFGKIQGKQCFIFFIVLSCERIIVPQWALHRLLITLHIQLSNPSSHHLEVVTKQYVYARDMDKFLDHVTQACHHCASLHLPPPNAVSFNFSIIMVVYLLNLVV